jgi:hypothetical protein
MTNIDYLKAGESYRGMSYSDWSVVWSNWLYSDDPDRTDKFDEHMIFLRGNLDYYKYAVEGDVADLAEEYKKFYNRTGDKAISICEGTAIFIPVLTAMYFVGREYEGATLSNEIQLRRAARRDNDMSGNIWATIQTSNKDLPQAIVDGDLTMFRVETPLFKLKISDKNPFIEYILSDIPAGTEEYDAVTDGYFLILKSLPSKSCRIQFGGKGRGNYRTDAVYDIYVTDCKLPTLVRDISNGDGTTHPGALPVNTKIPSYKNLTAFHQMS